MKEDDFFDTDSEENFDSDGEQLFDGNNVQTFEQNEEPDYNSDDQLFDTDKGPESKLPAPPPDDPTYYEKKSYGKSVYRRVQRLRRKAKRRGMEVPYLGYELHKPDKPRIFFWILAIISAIIFTGIVVGIGFLFAVIIMHITGMPSFGDAIGALFDSETMMHSFGLSSIGGVFLILIMILLYGLIAVAFLLPLAAIFYFYRSVRDTFYMAKCSKEEFAKGNVMESRIFKLGLTLVAMTVIFILLMVYVEIPVGRVLVGVIYAGLMLAVGGLLALILLEKSKCKKWFETLDVKQQANYLAHDGGLRKIKRRKKQERDAWTSMFP